MEQKRTYNKKEKTVVENKVDQPEEKQMPKQKIDLNSLAHEVNIRAIQTTKHLQKDKVYKCGKYTAAVLIEKGLAELV
jgi:hypothetical protein